VGNPALTGSGSTVPTPAHWYANGNDFSVASGQKLGAGPEMYNSMSAPHNCVGGSEQVFLFSQNAAHQCNESYSIEGSVLAGIFHFPYSIFFTGNVTGVTFGVTFVIFCEI